MRIICLILAFCTSAAFAQDSYKNIYSRHAWDERDKWQRADDLIEFLKISGGSHVADIGCHEGYMSFKLTKVVGDKGKVYAVDVDQSKLDRLKSFAESRDIQNVEAVKGDYDNPNLPTNGLDAIIILDTYHEMDEYEAVLRHIKLALKPGGRLVICEPIADARRKLSRADQERKHELGISYALKDLRAAGFIIDYQKDPFIDRTEEKGDKMWVIVAVKR